MEVGISGARDGGLITPFNAHQLSSIAVHSRSISLAVSARITIVLTHAHAGGSNYDTHGNHILHNTRYSHKRTRISVPIYQPPLAETGVECGKG